MAKQSACIPLLELFRRNLFLNSLLLLPYTIVLRLRSIIYPESYLLHAEDGYLNHLIFGILASSALLQSIIAILLIFIQAFYINHIVNKNRLSNIPNLLPGLVYILLMSSIPAFQLLSPILIAITFVLVTIDNLFLSNKKMSNAKRNFNVSFCISLASLFYFPFILFIPAAYISFFIVRSFKLDEQFQFFVGIFIPYFLVGTFYNWNDVLSKYLGEYISHNITFETVFSGINRYEILLLVFFILLTFYCFFNYNEYRKKKAIQAQKQIDILFWFLIFTIPTILFWRNLSETHFLIIIPFVSIFMGLSLMNFKNRMAAELIHLFAIVFLFILQFQLWSI